MKDQDVVDVNYEVLTLLQERCRVNRNAAIAQFGLSAKQAECLSGATRAQLKELAKKSRPVFQLHIDTNSLEDDVKPENPLCQLLREYHVIHHKSDLQVA